MANMGRYCKAYPVARLREFGGWVENGGNARKVKREIDGAEVEAPRELTDGDHLYLQENYVVTDGIFIDEHIVFADVTPEWKEFTKNVLEFEVPVYDTAGEPEGRPAAASA
jgi:hypothetical protein